MAVKSLRLIGDHPIWCGPVAVALIAGCSVNVAAQLYANLQNAKYRSTRFRDRLTSRSVSGVSDVETASVLSILGFDVHLVAGMAGFPVRSLDRWLTKLDSEIKVSIVIECHYLVAFEQRISDNQVQNVPACHHPYSDSTIRHAWAVRRKPIVDGTALAA